MKRVTALLSLLVGTTTIRQGPAALLLVGLLVVSVPFVRPAPAQPARVEALPSDSVANVPVPCTSVLRPSLALPVPAAPSSGPLSAPARWGALRSALLDPGFVFGSAGPGIGAHLEDDPTAWPDGARGLAARVGSHTGATLLRIGVTHGLAAGAGLDVRFAPRGEGALGPRLRHAVVETVTAQRADGTRVPNLPRLTGSYAAALAQARWENGVWRPGRAALSAALSLGVDLAVNVTTTLLQSSDDPERGGRPAPPERD